MTGRNNVLTSIAGRLRSQGKDEDEILAELIGHPERDGLPESECRAISRSVCNYPPGQSRNGRRAGDNRAGDTRGRAAKPSVVKPCERPEVGQRWGNGEITNVYEYQDQRGELLYLVARIEHADGSKRFAQFSEQHGRWWPTLHRVSPEGIKGDKTAVKRVLWRLPELAGAGTVVITEGEKACGAGMILERFVPPGLRWRFATDSGGAGKWRAEYNQTLSGKHVVVLPDNDAPGRAHSQGVALSVHGVTASVKVVELPGLEPKGDLHDWLANQPDLEAAADALTDLVEATPEWVPPADDNQSDPEDSADEQDTPKPLPVLSLAEFFKADIERPKFWIDGILTERGSLAISARAKTYKTRLAMQMSVALASGNCQLVGMEFREPARVLYVRGEVDDASFRYWFENLAADPLDGLDSRFLQNLHVVRINDRRPNLADLRVGRKDFEAMVESTEAQVVVLDALSNLFVGIKENDADAVSEALYGYLNSMSAKFGLAFILLHHHGKSGNYRGSTVIEAWPDSLISLQPVSEDDKSVLKVDASSDTKSLRDRSIGARRPRPNRGLS